MPYSRKKLLWYFGLFVCILIYLHSSVHTALSILALPITWNLGSTFLISKERDNFDLTFGSYSSTKQSSLPEYPDVVPPILHHIALGNNKPSYRHRNKWDEARSSCIEHHPGWATYLWTDDIAENFVKTKFPQLRSMWEGYRYPIQRIDALRYMVLYEYGGIVLDMDLQCLRSLGPLRRFNFTAPAAHPVGFSNGFMMASPKNPFVNELVSHLQMYNWNWFSLPYATVMFSTGCHYASTIHALQSSLSRSSFKILSGTKEKPNLHTLNGNVITPLFHHLGASSWHSFDAMIIVSLGKKRNLIWMLAGFSSVILSFAWVLIQRRFRHRRAYCRV